MDRPGAWTDAEDAMLKGCAGDGLTGGEAATAMNRSRGSIYARAARIGVTFNAAAHASPRRFLARGGVLIREEIGGAIGVVWRTAHRSGHGFSSPLCERLAQLGLIGSVPGAGNLYFKAGIPPAQSEAA